MVTKRDLRKERNREAILEAALEIAREEGWEKVTIRKIADRILYTPPIVYEHFKNKDDLMRQLVAQGFQQLRETTLGMLTDGEAPAERLKKMMGVRLKFDLENPTLVALMFDFTKPEWQRELAMQNMEAISSVAFAALKTHSGGTDEEVQEYFMNMVGLVMGYATMVNHFLNQKLPTQGMKQAMQQRMQEGFTPALPMVQLMAPNGRERVHGMFSRAMDRFLDSIQKQDQ